MYAKKVCCFCSSSIDRDDQLAFNLVVTNIKLRGDNPPIQHLVCHAQCLQNAVKDMPIDTDFALGD